MTKPTVTLFAISFLVASVFSTLADERFVHVQGQWLFTYSTKQVGPAHPFEGYIGEKTYYLAMKNRSGRDLVGTYDGSDYFWAQYFFPVALAERIPSSDTNRMGAAEVGPGSFPWRSGSEFQTLWLAYVWPADTNALTVGKCKLELGWMGGDNDYSAPYNEFTVELDVHGSGQRQHLAAAKFYAPGHGLSRTSPTKDYSLEPPYDEGWLFSEFAVLEWTNLLGRPIPIHFTLTKYHPRDKKHFNPPGRDRNDLFVTLRNEYWVTNCSVVAKMPGPYPPVWKGKMVGVKDYRENPNRPIYYNAGSRRPMLPGNAELVSRSSPLFKPLMRGLTGAELQASGNTLMKRIAVIGFLGLSGAVVAWTTLKQRRLAKTKVKT